MDADVAVVGAGTIGSMAAWQMAERGASVVAFEQYAPGHDRSAAGGESRIFRTAYQEGTEYVPLLLAARKEWERLERAVGRSLLELNGFMSIGRTDDEMIRRVQESAEKFNLDCEFLDQRAAKGRFPQHKLGNEDCVVLDHAGGYLHPELAVTYAAKRAELCGARILRKTHVTTVEPDGNGVTIIADRQSYRAKKVVVATGPWGGTTIGLSSPRVQAKRIVMTWFPAEDPDAFRPEVFPSFVRHGYGTRLCGWPTLDGEFVKVAIVYPYDPIRDPDSLDRTVSPVLLELVQECVREGLPGLVPYPARVAAYMDGYTTDGHGAVGWSPNAPNVLMALGFSGHGFKLSPIIGRVLADLALDGETAFPIDHLNPRRPFPREEQDARYVCDEIDQRLHTGGLST